jgi:tRNA A37 threonylcarbamoyladenosine biosynthesis protein TsaE
MAAALPHVAIASDEYIDYLEAIHAHLTALLQSFRKEPPRDVEARMRTAMLELRRRRQVLRLRPRTPVRLFELERRFRLGELECFVLSMLTAYMYSGEIRHEIAMISESRMDYVSLELLLRLFFPDRRARMAGLRELVNGVLVTEQLVEISSARVPAELVFAPIDLQPHAAHYLLGAHVMREVLPLECAVTQPPAEPFSERGIGDYLLEVCQRVSAPKILLTGAAGTGKTTLARQLAGHLGRELITFTGTVRNPSWPKLVAKVRAHDAFVLFRDQPPLLQSPSQPFLDALDTLDVPVMFTTDSATRVVGRIQRRMDVVIEIAATGERDRATAWSEQLRDAYGTVEVFGSAVEELAESFTFTRTQIADVVARLRRRSAVPPTRDQLQLACERQLDP